MMKSINHLQTLYDGNIGAYLKDISKINMLTAEEEYSLAVDWYENKSEDSVNTLITSYLPLVVKTAYSYRGYNLPISDLISEGTLGLIRSLAKFNPYKGFRLSTYSIWWIKAYITDYIINSWSMVKFGTIIARKRLFFSLKKLKEKLGIEGQQLNHDDISLIASEAKVKDRDVIDLNSMLFNKDLSINTKIAGDENKGSFADILPSDDLGPEDIAQDNQKLSNISSLINLAFDILNDREKFILEQRYLIDKPKSLSCIGEELGISKERVRQIEINALQKSKKHLEDKKQIAYL